MRYVTDMLTVLFVLVFGAGIGIAVSWVIYAAIADKIWYFSLEGALEGYAIAGLIGAVLGGGLALFLLSKISKRK
ncbi:MAG: hypothetical protein EKK31_16060 [Hyphomicrobiales bacterium]|nr:MAG: hypothetical protein EKK31_16060 [Hyphomicrobiales bacterium]